MITPADSIQICLTVFGVLVAAGLAIWISNREFRRTVLHQARQDSARFLDAASRLSTRITELAALDIESTDVAGEYKDIPSEHGSTVWEAKEDVITLLAECRHLNNLIQLTAPSPIKSGAQELFTACSSTEHRFQVLVLPTGRLANVVYIAPRARDVSSTFQSIADAIDRGMETLTLICLNPRCVVRRRKQGERKSRAQSRSGTAYGPGL